MRTLAAVLYQTGQPLQLEELEIPALRAGQVLVDITYSGVCHTQLLEVAGKRGVDRFLPHTLGHEGSGVVLEVGPEVRKVKPGDPVVLSWIKGEGMDVPGTVYRGGRIPVNSGAISTFLRRAVVSENRVVRIPAGMPLREATLFGCAVPTGVGVVVNTARVRPGSSVAVFGVGGIGLSAVLAANLMNATVIVAVDVVDWKLEQAKALGATHLVNPRTQDPITAILEISAGRGVDYAIEAAGRRETMETAFRSVRENGGLCVLAGNLPFGERFAVDPMDLIRGRQIVGTWGGETQPDRDIPMYVDLYQRGRLKLETLITHSYGLGEINQAFENLEQGKAGRTVIEMQ